MIHLKIDTILAIFTYIVRLLENTEARERQKVMTITEQLGDLERQRKLAEAEAQRSATVQKNIKALLGN
jgi:hypothetical protein